jgi:hypothetical protein
MILIQRHGARMGRDGRMGDMKLIRIPQAFYDDHTSGRDLPVLRQTAHHYIIDADHEDAPELFSDARFYADPSGPCRDVNFDRSYLGLLSSARATAKALSDAGVAYEGRE